MTTDNPGTKTVIQTLTIGERFNQATFRPAQSQDVPRLCQLLRRFGVYRLGKSRMKLSLIGVEVTDGMNLTLPDPQGVPFNARLASRVAAQVVKYVRDQTPDWQFDALYLCGRRVQTAFGLEHAKDFADFWMRPNGGLVYGQRSRDTVCGVLCVPHPSGLNHWWNDDVNIELGLDLTTRFLGRV